MPKCPPISQSPLGKQSKFFLKSCLFRILSSAYLCAKTELEEGSLRLVANELQSTFESFKGPLENLCVDGMPCRQD